MQTNTRIQLLVMMFLQFFVWGTWYATLGTYLGALKFDGSEIGNMFSTVNLGAIIAPLFVGMVADRFFDAQKVLGVLHLLGAVVLFSVSLYDTPGPVYWTLLLYSICYMPTLALANAVAFYQMDDPGKEFPSIRVLGTIGWIVAGLIIGFLKWEASKEQLYLGAIFSAVLGVYAFFLPKTPPKAKGEQVSMAKLLGLDAIKLMRDQSFAVIIISSLLISIPLAFYYAFTNPFLNESGMEYAASKMTLGQVSEILFLLLMPFFFKKLGIKNMILLAMACWAGRYLLFAFGNNEGLVWMFYLGIILHGICYDFFFVTGQIYVDEAAPESTRSSAQGLISLVTYGFGMYIGSIISGMVVEYYEVTDAAGNITAHDWNAIWLIPAGLAAIVLVIFAVTFKDNRVKKPK